jgi:hypothetical protein
MLLQPGNAGSNSAAGRVPAHRGIPKPRGRKLAWHQVGTLVVGDPRGVHRPLSHALNYDAVRSPPCPTPDPYRHRRG